MYTNKKQLLARADFVLAPRQAGDGRASKRWRAVLAEALPRLLGCQDRCPRARVRLHEGGEAVSYTAWLRIPVDRRPGRKRLRRFKAKLRTRLEAALLPVGGRVVKVGVRRLKARPRPLLALPLVEAGDPAA